jgi:hypothetical protein
MPQVEDDVDVVVDVDVVDEVVVELKSSLPPPHPFSKQHVPRICNDVDLKMLDIGVKARWRLMTESSRKRRWQGCSGGTTTSILCEGCCRSGPARVETTPQVLRPIVGACQPLTHDDCDVRALSRVPSGPGGLSTGNFGPRPAAMRAKTSLKSGPIALCVCPWRP